MKLAKLNAKGISHLIVPLVVLVGFGVVGSYLLVKSHAEVVPPPGGSSGNEILRYSYSGGSSTTSTSHTSGYWHFGSNFDVYFYPVCVNRTYQSSDYADISFYSSTLGRVWYAQDYRGLWTPGSNTIHLHSNLAQTLKMTFRTHYCSYTVRIYQGE